MFSSWAWNFFVVVIILVVDAKSGVTSSDEEVAAMLRSTRKPVLVVVNKVDSLKDEMEIFEFYNLGLGVLQKLMPQFQVYFLAMPLTIMIGLAILASLIVTILGLYRSFLETGLMRLIPS